MNGTRDWPIKTVGITGLKGNFGRDVGIEEPYWGHSVTVLEEINSCSTVTLVAAVGFDDMASRGMLEDVVERLTEQLKVTTESLKSMSEEF